MRSGTLASALEFEVRDFSTDFRVLITHVAHSKARVVRIVSGDGPRHVDDRNAWRTLTHQSSEFARRLCPRVLPAARGCRLPKEPPFEGLVGEAPDIGKVVKGVNNGSQRLSIRNRRPLGMTFHSE